MQPSVDITIEPSDKYKSVIRGEPELDPVPDTEAEYIEQSEHHEAADAYLETIEQAPTTEDIGKDPEDLPTLSWGDISPSSDPDLLAKIATYFDGMGPSEPADALRAKCRLLDVEVYADAQIAARSELRKE